MSDLCRITMPLRRPPSYVTGRSCSGKQPHSEQLTVISYIQFPTQTISTSQILLFIFAAGSSDDFLKPIRKKDKIPKDAAVAVVRAMALCPEPIFPL